MHEGAWSQESIQHLLNSVQLAIYVLFLSASCRKTQHLGRATAPKASESSWCQFPSPISTMTKLCHWITTTQKLSRMVIRRYCNISPTSSRCSLVCKNDIPHDRCGSHHSLPIDSANFWNCRQCVAECSRLVYNDVQAYKAQSQVFMRVVIVIEYIERILNNILRMS